MMKERKEEVKVKELSSLVELKFMKVKPGRFGLTKLI